MWLWGGVSVLWVCASLGCKAYVGVYRCSCPMCIAGLLPVLHWCLSLMSVSDGLSVLPVLCSELCSEWLEYRVLKVYTLIHHWHMQHFFKIRDCKVACFLIFEVCTVVFIKTQVFRYVRPCHLSRYNLAIWDC